MEQLEDLKLNMVVDQSAVDRALNGFLGAIKLSNRRDVDGRRLPSVDDLILETIEGDESLAIKVAAGANAAGVAWEAIARDLARQVIDAEAEIAEVIAAEETNAIPDAETERLTISRDYWRSRVEHIKDERDAADSRVTYWRDEYLTAASGRLDEQQAHCDTYVEALRMTDELAGWHGADAAEYRKVVPLFPNH